MKTKNQKKLYFIHANGFLPQAYSSLFKDIDTSVEIHNYLLLDLFRKQPNLELKNWIPFHNDFIKSVKTKNNIGIGHSIGGNIILRTAISNPKLFKAIILLDPTLFVPKIIFFWKLSKYLGLQNKIHPWLTSTLNRKMVYKDKEAIYKSYRGKTVFSKIDDKNLKIYINSIVEKNQNKYTINYSKNYEYQIYKTGLIEDNYIWKNIKNIKIPVLIIRAEKSNAFLENSANKVKKLNNNIKIITLRETTHLFPLEKPNETVNIINEFLKESKTNNL